MKSVAVKIVAITLLLRVAGYAQANDINAELKRLVETELAFAKTASDKGTKEAFLANLADDGILFRPNPVNGRKWTVENPESPGLLTWFPIFADIAVAGDLGYTTGPYEYRGKGPDDKEVAHGYFVSIWKKQSDGRWKLFIDVGTRNPPPLNKLDVFNPSAKKTQPLSEGSEINRESERVGLFREEERFALASESGKAPDAYQAFASGEIRLYRRGKFPSVGKDSLRSALGEMSGMMEWKVTHGDVSRSGDLAYVYGTYAAKKSSDEKPFEDGNYVRIWNKDLKGNWKIALDIAVPLPPTQSKPQ